VIAISAAMHAIAELVTLRLLDCLAEGTLVWLFAALVLRLAPRQDASTRFSVWFVALVSIAALPWVGGAWSRAGMQATAPKHAAITLPDSWAVYVSLVWGLTALWFLLRLARAIWHLRALRRQCDQVSIATLDTALQETLLRHGGGRQISLCTSNRVRVPTAVGLIKPAIVIPAWALRELSTAELNQILLHEIAHLRRWDDWTNLVQEMVKALFFFHPAVWWIGKKTVLEREIACDDAVLAETGNPRAYAECLARLAEKTFVSRSIALAQAAIGRIRQTSARVAEILDGNRPAPSLRPWRSVVVSSVALVVVCAASISRTPKLVAFEHSDQAPQVTVARVGAATSTEPSRLTDVSATPAKLSKKHAVRKAPPVRSDFTALAKISPPSEGMFQFAGAHSSAVPFTETFWVVIESGPSDLEFQQIQIQMWRVTVFKTVPGANRPIPNKEI